MKGKRLSARINSVPEITCNGSLLTNDMNGKLLGLEIDEELSFSSMLTPFVRKLHSALACYKKKKLWTICLLNKGYFFTMLWSGKELIMQVSSGRIVIKKALGESWSSRNKQLEWSWMPTQAPSVSLFNGLKWLPFQKDALISKCIICYKRFCLSKQST